MPRERLVAADRLIATRIRECRIMRGLSQRQLAELIGVSHRQAHKYEHGINGVSAGRLYEIARELNAPLEYFYRGIEQNDAQLLPRQRMLLDAMRYFGEIQNEKCLKAFNDFIRALASGTLK
jgi:transcriptional regulator with XRE-family HTH domain